MKSGVSYTGLEAVMKWALAAIGPADDRECLCLLPGKALIGDAAPDPRAQTRIPGRAQRPMERGVVGCTSGQPRLGRRVLRGCGRGRRGRPQQVFYPVAKPQFPGPGLPATPSRELSPPARYGGGSRDQDQHGRRRCWELRCRRRRAAGGNPPASPPSPAGLPRGPEHQRLGLGRHRAAAGGSR